VGNGHRQYQGPPESKFVTETKSWPPGPRVGAMSIRSDTYERTSLVPLPRLLFMPADMNPFCAGQSIETVPARVPFQESL